MLFSDKIKKNIEERNTVASTNTSVKDRRMGSCWIIANTEEKELVSNRFYHKK